jgi:hypothetical protein
MNPIRSICLLALLPLAAAVQAQGVKAPPLPPGSNMVRLEPGLNPDEGRRHIRAHHHKGHVKKDYTRDDGPGRGNDRDNNRDRDNNNRGNDGGRR